ncbi:hypothetical protein K8R33_02370 [archaeon]|nr:hypothetical protein [archaeon]
MVIKNKKGYLKTVEAIVALLLLFGVILFSINSRDVSEPAVPDDVVFVQDAVLNWMEHSTLFRDGVLSSSDTYIDTVNFIILFDLTRFASPYGLDIWFSIDEPRDASWFEDKGNVYVDSIIITGKDKNGVYQTRKLILYLWRQGDKPIQECPIFPFPDGVSCINHQECIDSSPFPLEDYKVWCDSGECKFQAIFC